MRRAGRTVVKGSGENVQRTKGGSISRVKSGLTSCILCRKKRELGGSKAQAGDGCVVFFQAMTSPGNMSDCSQLGLSPAPQEFWLHVPRLGAGKIV